MSIIEFLEARLNEDEQSIDPMNYGWWTYERYSRELDEKRRIVDLATNMAWHGGSYAVRDELIATIAAVYADHPDYDPAWATSPLVDDVVDLGDDPDPRCPQCDVRMEQWIWSRFHPEYIEPCGHFIGTRYYDQHGRLERIDLPADSLIGQTFHKADWPDMTRFI